MIIMKNAKLRHNLLWAILLLVHALCMIDSPAGGDVVHLKNGGRVEGKITRRNGKLEIAYRGGTIEVYASEVDRIETKPLPEEIFASRLRDVLGDADGCVELAEWAIKEGLKREYVQALRTAILADSRHSKARRLLRKYKLHYAELPRNEKAVQKMLLDMGYDFQVLRTEHFRICYNSTDIFADITAERLEKVYREFMYFFEDRNFEPAPLSDRLEVVLFDSPTEYQRFARTDSQEMAHSSGFYSSRKGRSYFFDSISEANTSYRHNKEKLLLEQKKIIDWRKKVRDNTDKRMQYTITESDGSERTLDRRQMLKELKRQERLLEEGFETLRKFYRSQNVSVTIHEATHQLGYTCGIHSKYYENPKWLVEGLAMYFEAGDEGSWDRPGLLNRNRIQSYMKAHKAGTLPTLKNLITIDKIFELSGSKAEASYAAAWGLFYYLVERHHEKFFDYIFDLSLRISGESYQPDERIEEFEKYFGDLDQLEKSWQRYIFQL